jgi:predicted metal-dependent peptidase
MKIDISQFMLWLLSERPFYGAMATSLNRVCKPGMGTMAVGVQNGRISLFYDPEFLAEIDMSAAVFILEHEMLHLALDHVPRYLELLSHLPEEARERAKPVFNIAADCAVNSLLRNNKNFSAAEKFTRKHIEQRVLKEGEKLSDTDGMCMPEKYGLPDLQAFETYQYALMRRVKVMNFKLKSHDGWTDGLEDGDSQESLTGEANRLREQLKGMLRKAVQHAGSQDRGLLPAGVEEFLREYLADPVIPWWEVFATRAKTSKAAKYRRSVTTPNRSLMALSEEHPDIIPFPGRVRDKSWRVFLMVDTSGSMSSESLEIVKSELHHMLRADEGMELRYMQGDAEVHFDVLLKPGDEIPAQVCGRGGTDFAAYFHYMARYVNDDSSKPDIVVVYTDGYCPAISQKERLPSEIPVLWLVTPNHSSEMAKDYGELIVCDPAHNGLYKK